MNDNCSERTTSALINRFVERAGLTGTLSPQSVMIELVSRVAKGGRRARRADASLQFLLRTRNVREVAMVSEEGSEGALRPLGTSYSAGFLLTLNKQASEGRRRFTLAHEICHTFFYELVPEIKFVPHEPSEDEERLCDLGAGELLMPRSLLRHSARDRAVCLESLAALANEYQVSMAAMLLRLRTLRLWRCELTEWHPMLNESFALRRVIGGAPKPWEWDDASVLPTAWHGRAKTGMARISYANEKGVRFHRAPTQYQVMRFGDRLLALWGPDVRSEGRTLPLFEARGSGRSMPQGCREADLSGGSNVSCSLPRKAGQR